MDTTVKDIISFLCGLSVFFMFYFALCDPEYNSVLWWILYD